MVYLFRPTVFDTMLHKYGVLQITSNVLKACACMTDMGISLAGIAVPQYSESKRQDEYRLEYIMVIVASVWLIGDSAA